MRILMLILSLAVLAVTVMSSPTEGRRTERSIREWFSGFLKRFQKKETPRRPYYLRPNYHSYYSYGNAASGHHGSSFQPHQPSFVQTTTFGGGLGGGHGAGHGGGHGAGHGGGHSAGHGGGHGAGHGGGHGAGHSASHGGGHGTGHGGEHGAGHGGHGGGHDAGHGGHGGGHDAGHGGGHNAGHGGRHDAGHGGGHDAGHGGGHGGGTGAAHGGGHGAGHGGASIPHGFGPLKTSDVIPVRSGSLHGHDHAGHSNALGGSFGGQDGGHGHGIGGHGDHNGGSQGHFPTAPVVPVVDDSYEAPAGPQQDSYVAPVTQNEFSVPSHASEGTAGGIDDGPSYIPPSNSIIPVVPTSIQYVPPSAAQLPLEQKEGTIPIESNYVGPPPLDHYQISAATNSHSAAVLQPNFYNPTAVASNNHVIVDGSSDHVYISHLGPDEPTFEIIFQDGEPAPPHPLPIIDESLFAPVSDDVEVYFIEYSPEDNLDDLKSLDLSGAQPAILQDLPSELPYELRSHLINSGVLENAQIEIIDLDKALHDQSLDLNTRNALRQAYRRTNRQLSLDSPVEKRAHDQALDIRVQRLNHDSSSPEGIVEFLSGLKTYRKGTYAGVVEVNDENTDKYLPVTIDGDKLPLPDNIPLKNKKVDGVLVLAPESQRKRREPKSTFTESTRLQASSSHPQPSIITNKQRRLLNIDWADMDTNGWIPIVEVNT